MTVRIGDLALAAGAVTVEQLDEARRWQGEHPGRIGAALVSLGYVTEAQVTDLVAKQYGLAAVNDLDALEVSGEVLALVPREHCQSHCVLPLDAAGRAAPPGHGGSHERLRGGPDPVPHRAAGEARRGGGGRHRAGGRRGSTARRRGCASSTRPRGAVSPARPPPPPRPGSELDRTDIAFEGVEIDADALGEDEAEIEQLRVGPEEIDLASLARGSADRPVVGLVNRILVEAYRRGASDIHVEPYEKEFCVRFRIDGVLVEYGNLPHPPPRDGDDADQDHGQPRHRRAASAAGRAHQDPDSPGRPRARPRLPRLGPADAVGREDRPAAPRQGEPHARHDEAGLRGGVAAPVPGRHREALRDRARDGPTGSGKTNTLYSAISILNKRDTNILTAEDPVEFNLRGINQVQIRENVGLSFAAVLREFMRQDPNIILVGEIRDYETAEIAVKAALTGHLVLSTLHTNDAPSTVSRLVNMGIEPFLVGTAVNLIQAQRLVRRICARCKADVTRELHARNLLDAGFDAGEIADLRVHRGRGCEACNGSGYKGRVGLYEVMEMSEGIRDIVLAGGTAVEIKRKALEEGMLTLRMSGLEKVRQGVTSLEEVLPRDGAVREVQSKAEHGVT